MTYDPVVRLYGAENEAQAAQSVETGWWGEIPLIKSETYEGYPCKILVNKTDIGFVPMRGSKMGVRQSMGGRKNEWQFFVARKMGFRWAKSYKKTPIFVIRGGQKDRWGPFGLNATCHNHLIDDCFAACFSGASGLDEGLVSIRHAYRSGGLWLGSVCYYAASDGLRDLADMVCETFEIERMMQDAA